MKLRRMLDRALSRWYVSRDRYDRVSANAVLWRVRYFAQVDAPLTTPIAHDRFIVTTDYQKGLPCS